MILHAAALEICGAFTSFILHAGFCGNIFDSGRLIVGALALGRFRFLMSVALSLLLNAINLTVQAAGAPVHGLYLLSAESALAALLWIVRLIVAGRRNAKRPDIYALASRDNGACCASGCAGDGRRCCCGLRLWRPWLCIWLCRALHGVAVRLA